MATKNYRKITVGDSFSNCIAYVKTYKYLKQTIQITDIVPSDSEGMLDIYVKSATDKDAAKVLWKSVSEEHILEAEYDLNFE